MDKPAPSMLATTLAGAKFDLAALRGKVVLINYWATWCVPCKQEIPVFNAFYKRHHGKGLEMIAISIDRPRDLEKARKMGTTLGYPAALAKDLTNDGFGPPEGVPLTYVVDANGVIRDKFIAVPEQLLNDIVLPLLPK